MCLNFNTWLLSLSSNVKIGHGYHFIGQYSILFLLIMVLSGDGTMFSLFIIWKLSILLNLSADELNPMEIKNGKVAGWPVIQNYTVLPDW